MSFDSDGLGGLRDLLNQTVTVSTRASHDNYGQPSYGSGTSWSAYGSHKSGFVRDANGETVSVSSVWYVASTRVIDISDRITLPDGTTPPIVVVDNLVGFTGTHSYSKISLGF
jgi:hypothetical protein